MRLIVLALAAGCAPATPGSPSWLADVRPIVAANCIRCHGGDGLGGAPATFRLDVYQDTCREGQTVPGAATMALFMAARASRRGDMPPRGTTLTGRQKDVIRKWAGTVELGTRPDNHPPAAELAGAVGPVDTTVTLEITVSDPDRDLVFGTLLANGTPIGSLRNGSQAIVWDASGFAAGSYPMTAQLDDGSGTVTSDLGAVQVAHGAADLPPAVTFVRPYADELFAVPEDIVVSLSAPDVEIAGLSATDGDQVVPLTSEPDDPTRWPSAQVPEGTSWRLVATVRRTGHSATATIRSALFMVSHQTTSFTFDDVKSVLSAKCAPCHDPSTIRGAGAGDCAVPLPVFSGLDPGAADFLLVRGRAWRKVVQQREMPPKSRTVVVGTDDLTEEERSRLGEWLFAGAPR